MRIFRKKDLEVDYGKEKGNINRKRQMGDGKLKIERVWEEKPGPGNCSLWLRVRLARKSDWQAASPL